MSGILGGGTAATLLLLLLLAVVVIELDARILLQHNTAWNREKGNPGVKLRLTKKGINYVKTVGVKLLNEQLATLSGYSTQYPFTQPGLEGFVNLQNVRVLRYRPPTLSVVNYLPPRSVVLGIESMDIALAADFFGTAGLLQVVGFMDAQLSGMTIAMTTTFETDQDGLMVVQPAINDGVRRKVPGLLCKKLKEIVERNSPRLFARLSRSDLGAQFHKEAGPMLRESSSGAMRSFVERFVDGLYMDNRNIANPTITNDYFETQQRGEVRYTTSRDETPFWPRAMNTSADSDRMLYIFGSDYVFNSILYHSYQADRLAVKLNKDNLSPKYRGFVRTSCKPTPGAASASIVDSICVGKLIPAIGDAYPNRTLAVVLLPHGLPDFRFQPPGAYVRMSSRLLLYIEEPNGVERQIMVASVDSQADLELHAGNGSFYGDLKLNRFATRLHRTAVDGVEPAAIEELAPLSKTFLGPQLSAALKKGAPFPLRDSVEFVKPRLTVHDGFVELATDFVLEESVLRQKVADAFRNLNNVGMGDN